MNNIKNQTLKCKIEEALRVIIQIDILTSLDMTLEAQENKR